MKKIFFVIFTLLSTTHLWANDNWQQASGPNNNWQTSGEAPIEWSVVRNENILWRTPMPEAGQSAVVISGDKAFTTIHVPLTEVKQKTKVKDIFGFCLDANTGKILWKVELPGTFQMDLASGFTDGSVFAPVTDGQHVWFFNRCGSMGCYDMEGKKIWLREFVPRNRHSNRQCEPIMFNNTILYVEIQDKEHHLKIKSPNDPSRKNTKLEAPDGSDPKTFWTYIHGIDKTTGKILWRENTGTSVHNTPILNTMANGCPAILHARGGGHGPLEKPYGLSLTSLKPGEEGKNIWSKETKDFAFYACHWNSKYAISLGSKTFSVLETETGKTIREESFTKPSDLWKHNSNTKEWTLQKEAKIIPTSFPITKQANILIGNWYYFLTGKGSYHLGRIHIETGKLEYLELPAQLLASEKSRSQDTLLWGKAHKNNVTNAQGFAVGHKGHNGSGWGHISAASPLLVGKYLFWPVVTGTVYVIDTSVDQLGKALVSINDLGIGGETWTLSSFSYARGNLYIHTMREIICIGTKKNSKSINKEK